MSVPRGQTLGIPFIIYNRRVGIYTGNKLNDLHPKLSSEQAGLLEMKIAYLARIDLAQPSGVLKKIARQIKYWEKSGFEVALFALSKSKQPAWEGLADIAFEGREANNYVQLFFSSNKAIHAIREWGPDLVYWRYSTSYPGVNRLMKRVKTIIEINSNYSSEYKAINKLGYGVHELFHRRAFKNAAGFCALTQEISNLVSVYNQPTLILGDGIDLESIPTLPTTTKDNPVLVCMATKPFPWIGVDKFLQLAEMFPKWQLSLIGLTKTAVSLDVIPENISFHGFLTKDKYTKLLAQADVAIGTLALHRIGLQQMAPLKLREYLAYGLPSIIAYEDADFPEDVPFLLKLPNSETNILDSKYLIQDFVNSWVGRRVPKHLVAHLSIRDKELERVEFFKSAAGN